MSSIQLNVLTFRWCKQCHLSFKYLIIYIYIYIYIFCLEYQLFEKILRGSLYLKAEIKSNLNIYFSFNP